MSSLFVEHPSFSVALHQPVRLSDACSLRRSRSAAQLNVGKRRASKGGTERYEGLWRSPLAHHFRTGPALHGRGRAAGAGVSVASRTSLPLRRDGHTKVYWGDQKSL